MRLRRISFDFNLLCLFLLIICWFSGDAQVIARDPLQGIHTYTRSVEFDYVDWILKATAFKLTQFVLDSPFYFTDLSQWQVVQDYLQVTGRVLETEGRLSQMYTDPSIHDPETASGPLRAELARLYQRQRQLTPFAEATLEYQIGQALADLGLTTGGKPLPPVLFHFSPLPWHLVISPRDRIEQAKVISLAPDLTVDRHVILEETIDRAFNVSSLVVPVGGLGTYPTMIMRSTSLEWVIDTVAHEWVHNWLSLRPLGWHYSTSPELRTMNETAASIAGHEIAQEVLRRYYPNLAVGGEIAEEVRYTLSERSQGEDAFDFNREMHRTRVRVDELLAQGNIEEAEAYMEQRRLFFWEHGYPIRKLNQAYFAFYGAYADLPAGPAGEDPVGPAVRALRARCNSLAEFLKTMAAMDSFQDLQDALQHTLSWATFGQYEDEVWVKDDFSYVYAW